ncbi:hypothetical protein HSHS1_19110 (plasmid) [Helicobacter suis HS1]|nr:hypothetical protein HSHS1_19110 [Helicobacter suis HS1]
MKIVIKATPKTLFETQKPPLTLRSPDYLNNSSVSSSTAVCMGLLGMFFMTDSVMAVKESN